ncbi:hypothetical protein BY996DRAFT_6529272 [Phakopsora pachyrhizi]|nr:hypothetical protein BY996DRAFT_6529272 [Phakopsora pachyrhizi]
MTLQLSLEILTVVHHHDGPLLRLEVVVAGVAPQVHDEHNLRSGRTLKEFNLPDQQPFEETEEGSTRVATVAENYQKREQAGLGRPTTQGILQGRRRKGYRRANNILQDQRRKGTIAGPTKARVRFKGTKIVQRIRKPWEEKRPAGGQISVGLVRRGETPRRLKDQRRTDIRDISKAVVGRAVNLLIKLGVGRRARRRHTEVRSSYRFRVGTKVNSTTSRDITWSHIE